MQVVNRTYQSQEMSIRVLWFMIRWSYSEDLLLAGGLMIFLDLTLKISSGPKLYQRMTNSLVRVLVILLA
jgi:hypothetical protein